MSNQPTAAYLGDGLYATIVNGQIELRANDFDHPTDTVYLEPAVLMRFLQYLKDNSIASDMLK